MIVTMIVAVLVMSVAMVVTVMVVIVAVVPMPVIVPAMRIAVAVAMPPVPMIVPRAAEDPRRREVDREADARDPQRRHEIVAGSGLDDVAVTWKRKVITRDRNFVGGNAIEQALASRHRERAVHVEDRAPVGMAGEQPGMIGGVAQRHHGMAAGCDRECLKEWKPFVAAADARPNGYWQIAVRPDGTRQWEYKGYVLYTYVRDSQSGDVNGNDMYDLVDGSEPDRYSAAEGGGSVGAAVFWHVATP